MYIMIICKCFFFIIIIVVDLQNKIRKRHRSKIGAL